MPEVFFNGPAGRLEGRFHPAKQRGAPIAVAAGAKRWPRNTQGCSLAEMNRRVSGVFRPGPEISGVSARLAASVPPETKTTPRGSAPASPATARRASSTIARACRPSAWIEDGLPRTSSAASVACRASGRSRAVAL